MLRVSDLIYKMGPGSRILPLGFWVPSMRCVPGLGSRVPPKVLGPTLTFRICHSFIKLIRLSKSPITQKVMREIYQSK